MKRVSFLAAAFGCLGAVACAADTFCADIQAVAAPDAAHALMLPEGLSAQLTQARADCQTSLAMSGQRHLHCHWSFDYRSDAATAAFEGLVDAMTVCLGPDTSLRADTSVNHPDAYDQQIFELAGRAYAVSIKDKGALQQTLVFVRVQLP